VPFAGPLTSSSDVRFNGYVRLYGLDAARGLLALVVCFEHLWHIFFRPFGADDWTGAVLGLAARGAVLSFFCLSGYVITLSIRRSFLEFGKFNLAEYFAARSLRIGPPLIFAILLAAAFAQFLTLVSSADAASVSQATRSKYVSDVGGQLRSLFTLCASGDLTGQINAPLWSLGLEIQLFTLTGLAVSAASRATPFVGRVLTGSGFLGFFTLTIASQSSLPALQLLAACYIAFLLGSLSMMCRDVQWPRVGSSLGLLGICAGIAFAFNIETLVSNLDTGLIPLLVEVIFSAAVSAILPILASIKQSVLGRFGRSSYTLYVSHFPVYLFVFFLIANNNFILPSPKVFMGGAILALFLSIVISVASARYLEQTEYFRRLKRLIHFRVR
jgi:peptidoglycan/LPS O-acetylase OafA/YrhL